VKRVPDKQAPIHIRGAMPVAWDACLRRLRASDTEAPSFNPGIVLTPRLRPPAIRPDVPSPARR
jgi:hypothetical protein